MKRFSGKKIALSFIYILLFVASLCIPFVINEAYKRGEGYVTLWAASDVLAFYGSYLSFLGTIALGIVAIYQNKRAYKLSEQVQKLQQAQYVSIISVAALEINKRNASHPNYLNSDMNISEIIDLTRAGSKSRNSYHIDVELENSSQYPIVQIRIHIGDLKNINCVFYGVKESVDSAIYIPAHGKQAVRLILPSDVLEQKSPKELPIHIDFVNIFDYVTPGTIYLEDIQDEHKNKNFKFRLSKFTDVRPKD